MKLLVANWVRKLEGFPTTGSAVYINVVGLRGGQHSAMPRIAEVRGIETGSRDAARSDVNGKP